MTNVESHINYRISRLARSITRILEIEISERVLEHHASHTNDGTLLLACCAAVSSELGLTHVHRKVPKLSLELKLCGQSQNNTLVSTYPGFLSLFTAQTPGSISMRPDPVRGLMKSSPSHGGTAAHRQSLGTAGVCHFALDVQCGTDAAWKRFRTFSPGHEHDTDLDVTACSSRSKL